MNPATLTVCIIARDEQQRLPRALRSVAWAAEIVLVDSGSRDRTLEIAIAAGVTVIEHEWRGFAVQRNVALDAAQGDWVLELDADEWCSDQLAAEIQTFLAAPPPQELSMCLLPMRQHYLGRALGPAGHYPFYRSRLFRRGSYRHDETRTVHEGLWPRERAWVFDGELHHELAGNVSEVLRDAWAYAGLEAAAIGGPVSARALLTGVMLRPPAKFAYQTVILGGWHDGARGILRSAVECCADALTWLRAATTARRCPRASLAADFADGAHFGRAAARVGPVHLLAVGGGLTEHAAWLQEAVDAGAWVSVICRGAGTGTDHAPFDALRVRALSRLTPLALVRAIDAEAQLAPFDCVVALDDRAARLLGLMPATVYSGAPVRRFAGSAAKLVRAAR